jgi:hypothetical protein
MPSSEKCSPTSGWKWLRPSSEFMPWQEGSSSWVSPSTGGSFGPRPIALERFKDQVRSRTRRQAPKSLGRMIDELNPVIRAWGNYFAQGDVVSLFEDLDGWIRERLRSKVRGSKARLVSCKHLPNRTLSGLGLVSLDSIVRSCKLSSV